MKTKLTKSLIAQSIGQQNHKNLQTVWHRQRLSKL